MQIHTSHSSAPRLLAIGALLFSILACQVQLTDATPTPGGTPSGACDDAAFVTDVSVPDGTVVKAGQPFTKTWRLSNAGTCTWNTGYRLAFVAGDAMGGASTQLGKDVPPAGQVDIAVTLTAPNSNGTYKGDWRMQNAGGVTFGSTVYVVVKVTDAAGPTATAASNGCPAGNFRVSGNLNVTDGVKFAFTGASSSPAVVFVEQGYYFCVPSGWSGTWTPSKGAAGNWSFSPASYAATVTQDLTGYHFVATPLIAPTATP